MRTQSETAPPPDAAALGEGLAARVAPGAPGPMLPRRYGVRTKQRLNADTVLLLLEPLDEPIGRFAPGQFNMLYAYAVGEAAISMNGAWSAEGLLQHTIREAGPISRALCATPEGGVIGVRGPFGTGWEIADAAGRDVVIVAGGLGLVPLRPAVLEVLADPVRYGTVSLLIGARSPDLLLFREEVDGWRKLGAHVEEIVDAAGPGWRGRVGLVTELIAGAPFDPANTLALTCGPEMMMRFTAQALIRSGIPPGDVRVSLERNMKCAVALCGHCQLGPTFICRDGAVYDWPAVAPWLGIREV